MVNLDPYFDSKLSRREICVANLITPCKWCKSGFSNNKIFNLKIWSLKYIITDEVKSYQAAFINLRAPHDKMDFCPQNYCAVLNTSLNLSCFTYDEDSCLTGCLLDKFTDEFDCLHPRLAMMIKNQSFNNGFLKKVTLACNVGPRWPSGLERQF